MTELCGLELQKKACGALGLQVAMVCGLYRCFRSDGSRFDFQEWTSPEQVWPHIEKDPAVAWPIFLEWCKAEHWLWQLEETVAGGYALHLRAKASKPTPHWNSFDVTGSNPCEAIARAIVKASEVKA